MEKSKAHKNFVFSLYLILFAIVSRETLGAPFLRSGDLLFQSFPSPACDAIRLETDSPYCHVGIAIWQGRALTILEAWPRGVRLIPWHIWNARTAGKDPHRYRSDVLGIWKDWDDQTVQKIAREALAFLGRPYDERFVWGEEKIYCSELVSFAVRRATEKDVLSPKPMTFTKAAPFWRTFFGGSPPEGMPGISPGHIAESSHLALWSFKAP